MSHVIITSAECRQISIHVRGNVAAQGSMDAMPIRKGQGDDKRIVGYRMQHRKTQKVKIGNWRADVKAAAEAVVAVTEGWLGPMDGPLAMVVHFVKPKIAAPRRVRWFDKLVEAVHWPWKQPDLDKMIRATFDAITAAGVIWHDDGQVVMVTASKSYAGSGTVATAPAEPGAMISIWQLPTVRLPVELSPRRGEEPLPTDAAFEAAAVSTLF